MGINTAPALEDGGGGQVGQKQITDSPGQDDGGGGGGLGGRCSRSLKMFGHPLWMALVGFNTCTTKLNLDL